MVAKSRTSPPPPKDGPRAPDASRRAERLIRPAELLERLNISKPTLWRMRRSGSFPEPIRISPGCVGWKESTVEKWISEREQEAQKRT